MLAVKFRKLSLEFRNANAVYKIGLLMATILKDLTDDYSTYSF